MKRIDVRSTENWRRFDFWAVIICILLLLLMLLAWIVGARFGGEQCCNNEEVAEQPAPIAEPIVVPEPEPVVVVPKEDYSLNFFSAGEKVILEGTVTDDATRELIILNARERFGENNVISNLNLSENITEFNTENLAGVFSQLSNVNDFRLSIKPEKWSVFGTVNDEDIYNNLNTNLADTAGTQVDNQLTLAKEEVVVSCEQQLSLNAVEFTLSSADITDAGKQAIAQVMRCLSNNDYDIVGHTDTTGNADANQRLSLARATAVRDYLTSLGVDTRAYTTTGKGESEPLIEGETPEANNRNRRVEFKAL